MAKFDKKKLAEACDGWQNVVCNQLCNENLPKNPEDWARLFETQAEKAIEENNKLLPAAFARTLKKETEALAKMFPNNKQNTKIMKEKTTVFVVSSKFCVDFFVDAAFSTKQQAEDFITQHEMSSGYITELTIDEPSEEYTHDMPFRPTPRPDERVNHPRHYQHPSGIECITVARHHDFNTGSALKYLWRAGLKQEQGISPLDKQIEDLQKAVWFLQDEIKFLQEKQQEQ